MPGWNHIQIKIKIGSPKFKTKKIHLLKGTYNILVIQYYHGGSKSSAAMTYHDKDVIQHIT